MTPFSHSLILQELVKGVTSATQPRFVSQRTDVIETVVEDTDHGLNDGEKRNVVREGTNHDADSKNFTDVITQNS